MTRSTLFYVLYYYKFNIHHCLNVFVCNSTNVFAVNTQIILNTDSTSNDSVCGDKRRASFTSAIVGIR